MSASDQFGGILQPGKPMEQGKFYMLPRREDLEAGERTIAEQALITAYDWLQTHPEEHPNIAFEDLMVRDVVRCVVQEHLGKPIPGAAQLILKHFNGEDLAADVIVSLTYQRAVKSQDV